jgi:hypothetical protein
MFACSGKPGRDGGVPMPEDACSGGNIEPFSQGCQDFSHPRCWRLEPVQRRIPTRTERCVAGLAAERLNALSLAVPTIADQRVDLRIRDLIVRAGAVETGEALRGNPFRRTTATFDLTPWADAGG